MRLFPSHLALIAALSSLPASAQVAFIMDMMTSHMCIANNWETPSWQKQFAKLNDTQKGKLRLGLESQLSPQAVHCLETTRPYPEGACAKVIDKVSGHAPSVGGGEPFIGADLERELQIGSEKAFRCLELKPGAAIS